MDFGFIEAGVKVEKTGCVAEGEGIDMEKLWWGC